MGNYIIETRETGERLVIAATAVERIVGVELAYIDWAIQQDGQFENGAYRITQNTGAARAIGDGAQAQGNRT